MPRLSRRLWLVFALFVVYGTTIPFNFTSDHDVVQLHLSRISLNPFLDLETGHRISLTDTVQNILLFLPFGVLGVLASPTNRRRIPRIIFVTVLGAALSCSVETVQLFTRDRISSLSDVMTNTTGAFLGALMVQSVRDFPAVGLRWLKKNGFVDRPAFYAFLVAAILVCLAQWEPFDVTIDVGGMWAKAKALRADVWQYTGLNDEAIALTQFALFGAAAFAWLQELGLTDPARLAMVLGVPLAFGLEASQIFIGSRMPGLEDAVVRGVGVVVGVWLCSVGRRGRPSSAWTALVIAATAVGAGMQMLNPFQLAATPNPVQWLPFMNYYEVTTFSTLSHALELMLIYFPMGFFIATMRARASRSSWIVAFLTTLAIAVPIEFGQRFVVGRFPDATDPTLSAIGGWLGAWAGTSGKSYFDATVARLDAPTLQNKV